MINVTFLKTGNRYYYFESTGHANYDEHGKDLVCAAVSVLAQTLVNSIIKLSTIDPVVEINKEKGYLKCEIPKDKSILDDIKIQTTFEVTKVGIESISEVYDDYVKLFEKNDEDE